MGMFEEKPFDEGFVAVGVQRQAEVLEEQAPGGGA